MNNTSRVAVRLLGPLEVFVGARSITLSAGRLRTIIVRLALSAGRAVTVDQLTAAVWGQDLPVDVRRTIATYVARLRAALGAPSITFGQDGYTLRIAPDDVDGLRFASLLSTAAGAMNSATEKELLAEALALWRGFPFEGVHSAWLAESEAPWIIERYLSAVERWAELRLAAGGGAELVPQLRELTAWFPMRESLLARLLVVLDRCGRPVEALEHYEKIRARFVHHLGVDPGPELRDIHRQLLARTLPGATIGDRPALQVTPHQLPADVQRVHRQNRTIGGIGQDIRR